MADPFERLKRYLNGPPKIRQEDFADVIGASQAMVSRIVNRKTVPTLAQAARIEAKTGIRISAWARFIGHLGERAA